MLTNVLDKLSILSLLPVSFISCQGFLPPHCKTESKFSSMACRVWGKGLWGQWQSHICPCSAPPFLSLMMSRSPFLLLFCDTTVPRIFLCGHSCLRTLFHLRLSLQGSKTRSHGTGSPSPRTWLIRLSRRFTARSRVKRRSWPRPLRRMPLQWTLPTSACPPHPATKWGTR